MPTEDFHIGTLRYIAGQARRDLDAHDRRSIRPTPTSASARAALERAARVAKQRLVAAQLRRYDD